MRISDETGYKPRTAQQVAACSKQTVLLNEYEEAAATLLEAVTRLRASMVVLSREEYDTAYQRTEDLRMIAGEKQESLIDHGLTHARRRR